MDAADVTATALVWGASRVQTNSCGCSDAGDRTILVAGVDLMVPSDSLGVINSPEGVHVGDRLRAIRDAMHTHVY